jgi:anti-anti-sigma factor
MDIHIKKDGEVTVFSISGRLDTTTSPELEKEIGARVDKGEITLAMDMTGLDYISSAGLRVILAAAKKLRSRNGKIFLSGLKPPVMEVFKISGFDAIIPIFDTVEAAKEKI